MSIKNSPGDYQLLLTNLPENDTGRKILPIYGYSEICISFNILFRSGMTNENETPSEVLNDVKNVVTSKRSVDFETTFNP